MQRVPEDVLRRDEVGSLRVPCEGEMRIVVTGSRNADEKDCGFVVRALDALAKQYKLTGIAHGAASGVDVFADAWGKRYGISVEAFPADWDEHGPAAGPIRNREMLEQFKPQLVIAFPEPKSRPTGSGTWDTIEAAVERGIFVRIYALPPT